MSLPLRSPSHRIVLFGFGLLILTGTGQVGAAISINSTSQNLSTLPSAPVREQAKPNSGNFQVLANNDLGMHCEVQDHRVLSLLPLFNCMHAQVIKKGDPPQILTDTSTQLFYSASSNPNDPILAKSAQPPVYKTDFWDPNLNSTDCLGFDGYKALYPPGILSAFPLTPDTGLPVPDVERLYLGDGKLIADQQKMPGIGNPGTTNAPQAFNRFNTDYPFFISFPFGYTLKSVNWFAAEGIPVSPVDDFGRYNPFPLMRVQAVDKTGSLTGKTGAVIASIDTVTPVATEITCYKCHTSSKDGGTGVAACTHGIDANCKAQGSSYSGTQFAVATSADDTSVFSAGVKKEWAADMNIIRLHDARNGTQLESATPIVCQSCHYSPALDLAQVGPMGPADAEANGRAQRIHHTNSRAVHTFHSGLNLFPDMPAPNDPKRYDSTAGKPVVNTLVQTALENSCYLCHPGKETKCLRGAMFNGGLVCQDCHGGMKQVGDDFSLGFSDSSPFPSGMTAGKRIPWGNEPGCQSCHTGDAMDNLTSDPNVIKSSDGVRLLRAYRSNDPTATPIVATNRRFAENQTSDGRQILFRASREAHVKLSCETCHGSTHAEWPVVGAAGTDVANDNIAAIQLQGYPGVIMECTVCHTGTMADSLDGPHGMHPVAQSWVKGHRRLADRNENACRACHGPKGKGTVLSKVRTNRTFSANGRTRNLQAGTLLDCGVCHWNPL